MMRCAPVKHVANRVPGRSLLIAFFLFASSAAAELRESLAYTYYDAAANPGQSLLLSLNSASPIKENGRVFHGYTKWHVRWNFRWNERRDGTCNIASAKTEVTGTITMPKLVGGTVEQNLAFDRYTAALKQHEVGHYQIGKDAAIAIDRELLVLPAMTDCGSLERAANAGAYQTLEQHKEKERQYDAATGHGISQGAWLEK